MKRASVFFGLLAGALSSSAWAQTPRAGEESQNPPLLSQRFTPAPSPSDFLVTFGMSPLPRFGYSLGFFSDFQHDPVTVRFVFFDPEGGPDLGGDAVDVVSAQVVSHLMGAVALRERVELAFDMPFFVLQDGEGLSVNGGAGQGVPARGVGDPRLYARVHAYDLPLAGGNLSLGGVAGLSLPFGNEGGFMGEAGATGSIRAVGDFTLNKIRVAGNLGYLARPNQEFLTLILADELTYNLAGSYQVNSTFAAALEMSGGASASKDLRDVDSSHLELDAAIRMSAGTGIALTGGIGTGLIAGIGNPDLRIFIGLRFSPPSSGDIDSDGIADADDQCLRKPETINDFNDEDGCPDTLGEEEKSADQVADANDEDADGIVNEKDQCPEQPEDADRFEDEDGCADLDNDKDGVNDSAEKCDNEAEDKDGFEDEDGCIDPDDDQDGIPDTADKCRLEAEDKDKHADQDGCPEIDADQDGLADETDTCPDEAESFNGNADDDGCPDEGASALSFPSSGQGEVGGAEKIQFQKGKLQLSADSLKVLDELVARMKANPKAQLTIIVSPDKAGKASETLARERAEGVSGYLQAFGVEQERVLVQVGTTVGAPTRLSLAQTSPKAP